MQIRAFPEHPRRGAMPRAAVTSQTDSRDA